jgi:16S rRNA (adenine(1408)-N(1))-methyltransferase
MRIVTGRRSEEMDATAFGRLAAEHALVLVDLGCGDGAFPYRVARAHADVLAVGVDPNAEAMAERAAQARRKAARGGAPNALFVAGSIEELPPELDHAAAIVTVNFPWAGLLRAVVDADPLLVQALDRLAAAGCVFQLLVNADAEVEGEPDLSPPALAAALSAPLTSAGCTVDRAEWLPADARVPSRWGGRLIAGSGRRIALVRATRGDPPARALAVLDQATGLSQPGP